MAAVIGSEAVVIPAGANPAAVNITVPVGATRVLVGWGWYNGSAGNTISTCTLGGNAFDASFDVPSVGTGNGQPAVGCVGFNNPASGVQALDFAWTVAPGDGPTCIAVYVDDAGTPAPWRAAVGGNDEQANAVSATLNSIVVGDLVLMFDCRFAATPPGTPAGWTSVNTQTNNNSYSSRVSSLVAAATSQLCEAQNESYTGMVAIAIPDAVAASSEVELMASRQLFIAP